MKASRFIALLIASMGACGALASEATIKQVYDRTANLNAAEGITELVFNPGSSDLTVDAKNQLRDFIALSRSQGTIAEVKIVSWADKEYPGDHRRTLDRSQRRLADERNQEIRNFITDGKSLAVNVKTELYNMAEKPEAMENLFSTSNNVKLKGSLEKTGLAHPNRTAMPPKAARALVMIVYR